MAIANNSSIKLDIHSPKKDAVVAVGTPGTTTSDIAVWAAASVDETRTQSIVGTFDVLRRYALNNLASLPATGPTILHVDNGATIANVEVDGTPTATQVRLEIGADVITKGGEAKQNSHFLNRTFDRLVERWLEESK